MSHLERRQSTIHPRSKKNAKIAKLMEKHILYPKL